MARPLTPPAAALLRLFSAAFLAVLVSSSRPDALENSSRYVLLYNYEGNPLIIRNRRPVPPAIDLVLQKKDVIQADKETMVELTLFDFAGVRFFPDSEVEIVSLFPSAVHVKLNKGGFLANVKSLAPDATFTIETPLVTVSPRPPFAQYCGVVLPGGGMSFASKKGNADILVKLSSSSIIVLEGLAVDVMPETFAPTVRNSTEEEQALLRKVNTVPVNQVIEEKEENAF